MDLTTLLPQVELSVLSPHLIPYAIILLNYLLFRALRSFVNKTFAYYLYEHQTTSKQGNKQHSNKRSNANGGGGGKIYLAKLFLDELISTVELCADCAELNVVYEKHGSLAYGLSLFILTYLWIDAFGDAQTSPGYLFEEYFLVEGNQLLKSGSTYARFIGQSLAMPLAWRFASFYWKYQLISEHNEHMLMNENCKSSLNTSTINGFLIEFTCCLVCRLLELVGHKLLQRQHLSQRFVSLLSSFICTALVVVALELSGGYFNPVLAASLEYGCKGIHLYQHALVFWIGPLLGHLVARGLFKRMTTSDHPRQSASAHSRDHRRSPSQKKTAAAESAKRLTRANSQRKKHAD